MQIPLPLSRFSSFPFAAHVLENFSNAALDTSFIVFPCLEHSGATLSHPLPSALTSACIRMAAVLFPDPNASTFT
jgi:hypothetical protein